MTWAKVQPGGVLLFVPSVGEALQELFEGEGIQDVFFLDPRPAGRGNAEVDVVKVCNGVGVGVDDEGQPGLFDLAGMGVVEVETEGGRVDLEGHAALACGVDQLIKIDIRGLAFA